MKRIVLTGLLASVLATGVATASEAPHWSYSGADGPAHWAALAPQFGACNGKNQSPIDLTGLVEAELPPIKVSYSAGGTEVVNNGHTAQVNFGPGSSLMVGGTRYELKQVHFHAPSENHINGKAYPLEAHLVHADKAGNLLVVALMFEEGTGRPVADAAARRGREAGTGQAVCRRGAAAGQSGLLQLQRLADHAAVHRRRALGGDQGAGQCVEGAGRSLRPPDAPPEQSAGAAGLRPDRIEVSALRRRSPAVPCCHLTDAGN